MSREAQTDLEYQFELELGRYIASFDGSDAHWKTLKALMKRRFPRCELLDHWETRDLDASNASGVKASVTFAYLCNGREKKRRYDITV